MNTLIVLMMSLVGLAAGSNNGNGVGNGGVGFLCDKNGKKEVRVLDLTEMQGKPEASLQNLKREEALKKVWQNLERLAPSLSKQYARRFQGFDDHVEFRSDVDLTKTNDTLHLASPKGCELKQLAIRRVQKDSLSKDFMIDREMWDLMDESGRTALTLHEIVYDHFAKLGEKNSVKARKITGYLLSEKSFKDKPEDFWKLIGELSLPIYQ
ncbi:MAG: hypothetical protein KF681_05130 [Bdellovibrionaceae bacterium]|nr:hypothetical protein [Pseudobdellovibrionaceae bacterium]